MSVLSYIVFKTCLQDCIQCIACDENECENIAIFFFFSPEPKKDTSSFDEWPCDVTANAVSNTTHVIWLMYWNIIAADFVNVYLATTLWLFCGRQLIDDAMWAKNMKADSIRPNSAPYGASWKFPNRISRDWNWFLPVGISCTLYIYEMNAVGAPKWSVDICREKKFLRHTNQTWMNIYLELFAIWPGFGLNGWKRKYINNFYYHLHTHSFICCAYIPMLVKNDDVFEPIRGSSIQWNVVRSVQQLFCHTLNHLCRCIYFEDFSIALSNASQFNRRIEWTYGNSERTKTSAPATKRNSTSMPKEREKNEICVAVNECEWEKGFFITLSHRYANASLGVYSFIW